MVALGANLHTAAALAHAQSVKSGARTKKCHHAGKLVSLKNGYSDASKTGMGFPLFETGSSAVEGKAAYCNDDALSPKNAG
jgi:hypothetical protein